MYIVYMWTNKRNGKRYIGQTKQTLEQRAGRDGAGYRGCYRFYTAIKKYGFSAFESKVLESGLTKKAADYMEKFYIRKYKTQNPTYGYNICPGGTYVPPRKHKRKRTNLEAKIKRLTKELNSAAAYRRKAKLSK